MLTTEVRQVGDWSTERDIRAKGRKLPRQIAAVDYTESPVVELVPEPVGYGRPAASSAIPQCLL